MISLRAKVVVLITGSMVLLGGLAYYASTALFLSNFSRLEAEFAQRQILKDQSSFEQYLEKLGISARDYSYWDTTYEYMMGNEPDFVEDNFLPDSLANLDIDLVAIYDRTGKIRFARMVDLINVEVVDIPEVVQAYLNSQSPQFATEQIGEGLSGMQALGEDIYFLAASSILYSDRSGEPAGSLLFGRRLDQDLAASLAAGENQLQIFWLSNPAIPPPIWHAAQRLPASSPRAVTAIDRDHLAAYFLQPGLDGTPMMLVWQILPRELSRQADSTLNYFGSVLAVLSLSVALMVWVVLDRSLLRRIASLAEQVRQSTGAAREKPNVHVDGNDEISALAKTVNETLLALREAQNQQIHERDLVKSILASSPDAFIVVALDGFIMDCNDAALRTFGSPHHSEVIGSSLFNLIAQRSQNFGRLIFEELLSKGELHNVPIKLTTFTGVDFSGELSGQLVPAKGSLPAFCVLLSRDVTERMQWEESLRESEERYRNMVEYGGEAISILSPDGVFLFANPAAERVLGASPDGLVGQSFQGFLQPASIDLFKLEMEKRQQGHSGTFEVHFRRTDGEERDLLVTATPWASGTQGYQGAFCNFRDISERKQAEERLVYLSTHDALTGLFNRSFFEQRLARLENDLFYPVGFLIGDLNHLKLVNDRDGHAAGDELLRTTARLLRSAFRDEDIVARLGGDEFGVILPGASQPALEQAIQRVQMRIAEYNAKPGSKPVSLAIGGAFADNNESLADAVARADLKMYADKHRRESLVQAL